MRMAIFFFLFGFFSIDNKERNERFYMIQHLFEFINNISQYVTFKACLLLYLHQDRDDETFLELIIQSD